MAKLTIVCEGEIGQSEISVPGLYAFRNIQLGIEKPDKADKGWIFGTLFEGQEMPHGFEWVGPITFKTIE